MGRSGFTTSAMLENALFECSVSQCEGLEQLLAQGRSLAAAEVHNVDPWLASRLVLVTTHPLNAFILGP
jgi:hypothetical protein